MLPLGGPLAPGHRSGVVGDLLAADLIDIEDLMEGGLSISPAGGRGARSLRIEGAGRRALAKPLTDDARGEAEAAMWRLVTRRGSPVAAHVPRVISVGELLAVELIAPARNLAQLFADAPSSPPDVGAALGRILAALHRPCDADPSPLPLPLRLPDLGVDVYATLSGANLELVEEVQAARVEDVLRDLREDWRSIHLIHGDLHPANVVVGPAPAAGEPPLWLVDWEFAGAGEPAWDVACVLAHHLAHWVSSIPEQPGGAGADEALCPLERLHHAMGALWSSYVHRVREPEGSDALRTARYTGAALIEVALALGMDAHRMSVRSRRILQLAANVLERPADALPLLGLPTSVTAGATERL